MPKGNDPKLAPPHHTSAFFVDDAGMKTGIKLFCQLAVDYLGVK
jgi:amidohydrolase